MEVLEEKIWAKITGFPSPNRSLAEEQVKNMREMGEMGEEEGFCIFLIRDNVVDGDNDILLFLFK